MMFAIDRASSHPSGTTPDVDGETSEALSALGISTDAVLQDNDAYNALRRVNGLVFTGPTGTNVNDVAVALIR